MVFEICAGFGNSLTKSSITYLLEDLATKNHKLAITPYDNISLRPT